MYHFSFVWKIKVAVYFYFKWNALPEGLKEFMGQLMVALFHKLASSRAGHFCLEIFYRNPLVSLVSTGFNYVCSLASGMLANLHYDPNFSHDAHIWFINIIRCKQCVANNPQQSWAEPTPRIQIEEELFPRDLQGFPTFHWDVQSIVANNRKKQLFFHCQKSFLHYER